MVDDTVDIVVRSDDRPLSGTTFVVFDTETTGFNAGGTDQMIEIGAVKIKDGNIIDRFVNLLIQVDIFLTRLRHLLVLLMIWLRVRIMKRMLLRDS